MHFCITLYSTGRLCLPTCCTPLSALKLAVEVRCSESRYYDWRIHDGVHFCLSLFAAAPWFYIILPPHSVSLVCLENFYHFLQEGGVTNSLNFPLSKAPWFQAFHPVGVSTYMYGVCAGACVCVCVCICVHLVLVLVRASIRVRLCACLCINMDMRHLSLLELPASLGSSAGRLLRPCMFPP